MEHSLERSGTLTTLTIEGELTLPHAEGLKAALLALLGEEGDVAVRLTRVTDMDLSCLQLLCSAHRTADAGGRNLTLSAEDPREFRRLREAAGFVREKGCGPGREHTCLWLEMADNKD